MTYNPIKEAMKQAGATQREVGVALGIDTSTVCRKVNGLRRWTVDDANRLLQFLRERGSKASYEELFFTGERGDATEAGVAVEKSKGKKHV